MRIQARLIDPLTGERESSPAIACPARRDEVNPQYTCMTCPFQADMETYQVADDRGGAYHAVSAVECAYEPSATERPARWLTFPDLFGSPRPPDPDLARPGVVCPLYSDPARAAPVRLERYGMRWVPIATCLPCQFYGGSVGAERPRVEGGPSGLRVLCRCPDRA